MPFKSVIASVGTGTAVVCAVAMTAIAARHEFASSKRATIQTARESRMVKDWQQYALAGHRMGSASAPVTIVEFADFECPACRRFVTKALDPVRREFPDQVSVVFRHWPLTYHHFAYPAARAAECAGAQGRFEAFYNSLYKSQDSLGVKTFDDFAATSGVPDLSAYGYP